jgi:hypothetical protein
MALLRKLCLGFALPMLLAGCQDPAGPCDRPNACEVHGVDLFITHLELVTTRFDSIDGLGVVRSDTVEIESVVRNRGDTISEPTILILRYTYASEDSAVVPALRPGESHVERTRLATWFGGWSYMGVAAGDTARVLAQLLLPDADTSNNWGISPQVHIALPMLEMALALADTDIWVNEPVAARLTMWNRSRHATLGPKAVGFFLRTPPPQSDLAGATTFGMHDVPPLPPSSRYEEDLVLTVPSRAGWQDQGGRFTLHPVLAGAGASDSPNPFPMLSSVATITLHPDYRACEPALLKPDSVVLAPYVCNVPVPIYVFELEAHADRLYGIEQPDMPYPGATVFRADGSRWGNVFPGMRVQFAAPGTYWVVDYWGGGWYDTPPVRVMRLREWPQPDPWDAGGTQ